MVGPNDQLHHRTIIAIVGLIGAGKDEAANYLGKKLGWHIAQVSQPLKNELKNRGLEVNRDNLAALGDEFSRKYGDGHLAKQILAQNSGDLVISGPRQLGQIEHFKLNSRFILIAVTAPDEIRFTRVQSRPGTKEAVTLQEFVENERKCDCSGRANKTNKCLELANHEVENKGSFADLHRQLDEILQKEELIL